MSGGPDTSSSADLSTGQLISQLSEQTSTLVRSELQLAKVELTNSAKHAGLGVGLFSVAGVLALFGLGALIATAIIALDLVLPPVGCRADRDVGALRGGRYRRAGG